MQILILCICLLTPGIVIFVAAKAVSHALCCLAKSIRLLGFLRLRPTLLLLLELLQLGLHLLHRWRWFVGCHVHLLEHLCHLLHDHLILLFEVAQLIVSGFLPC